MGLPRVALVGLATAAVLVVVGCGSGDSPAVSASAGSDERSTTSVDPAGSPDGSVFPRDWEPPELQWSDCGLPRDGACATLTVPLDWARPDGATVDLAVGMIPASGARIGSLVTNPGGPGGSGLDFLAADPLSPDLARRFDLVSWDPRGVGASTALRCGDQVAPFLAMDPDPDDESEQAALDRAAAAVATECGEEDSVLLAHLGTDDVARDMEALRRALGDEPLNYLGFSYGTDIGQSYAEQFPHRIRTMVLDGVVDPSVGFEDFLAAQAAAFEVAFADQAEQCAAAGVSSCGVADLADAYDRVKAAVEVEPLRGGDEPVGPAALATAAIQTSYGTDGWRSLGPALAAGLDGDGALLWELAASYYDVSQFTSYAAVVCIDAPPPRDAAAYRSFADRLRRESPRFGAATANELASCATWPVPPVGTARPVVADGAPPILVVGNTGDAATPYANAVAVASTLASGVLLTVEIDGHTAYGSNRCATAVIDDYLIELVVPPDGTVCAA